jgi:hypothetical protein
VVDPAIYARVSRLQEDMEGSEGCTGPRLVRHPNADDLPHAQADDRSASSPKASWRPSITSTAGPEIRARNDPGRSSARPQGHDEERAEQQGRHQAAFAPMFYENGPTRLSGEHGSGYAAVDDGSAR